MRHERRRRRRAAGRAADRSRATSAMPAVGVVARVALADVVEQGAEHEQVGPAHAVGQRGGVGRRLPEVPVDGEAVVGVALRAAAHRRPLGQQPHEDAALVERLEDVDRPVALRAAARRARRAAPVRPALRPHVAASTSAARRSSVGAGQRDVALGGDARRPQHEHRVGGEVGARRQLDLAVDDDQPVADALLVAELVAREVSPRPFGDPARSCAAAAATLGHQVVGRRGPSARRHGVLVLEAQHVAGPAGHAVQGDAGVDERAVARRRARRGRRPGRRGRHRPPTTASARRAARRGRP